MSRENAEGRLASPRLKIRVESLSDLVFGLALSIGSLELLARTPTGPVELAVSVGFFAFSFFILVSTWIGYARIMAVLPQETGGAIGLNLLLLFCVVLEPYLFFVLQSKPLDSYFLDWTSFAYALDVGSIFLILAGLIQLIFRERKEGVVLNLHPELLWRFRLVRKFYLIVGGAYVLSALPFFWVDSPIGPLRFDLWYSAFAFMFLGVITRRHARVQRSRVNLEQKQVPSL